jgi:signal transduction histidine kinase
LSNHPALSLLLVTGLLLFWLMPAIAWVLLKGQRDVAAKFWFAGTACYAGTALLFVLQSVLPNAITFIFGLSLVPLMLAFLMESLRRELRTTPTPWAWIIALVPFNAVILIVIERQAGIEMMRVVQLVIVTLLDIGCCVLLAVVARRYKSRALVIVIVGFVVVVVTNLLRIHGYLSRGESASLLAFSPIANIAFVANYLSVVVYSFGYWGFVIEKNRAALLTENLERARAQRSEVQALDRERLTLDLVRQRDELITTLARMQRAAQAGALTASIAHEINQPLAVVRLSVEEAIELEREGGDPSRLKLLLSQIADENVRAASIIRTLRDIFGGQPSQPDIRSIDEIVASTYTLLNKRATDVRISLRTELSAPVRARASRGELEHVLLNLAANALEALSNAGTKNPEVVLSTRIDDDVVVIEVRDNGPGISDSVRDTLFDLFSGSRDDGLGLGLWLSRYIVERNGGTLALSTTDNSQGACFMVSLQLMDPQPSRLG